MMKRKLLFTITAIGISLLLSPLTARAQSADVPKYEVAADFTSLSLDSGTSLPGFGGRFTFNLNKHFALEAAGYFFPGNCEFCNGETTGHITQGLFGVKAGKRFKKWGVFAKARPGFASFAQGAFSVTPASLATGSGQLQCYGANPSNPMPCFRIQHDRLNHAVLDVGGVLEFYPSRRLVVRFDGGDTMIRYTRRTYNTLFADPANPTSGIPVLAPFTDPARTRHSFQFMGGVGFRF